MRRSPVFVPPRNDIGRESLTKYKCIFSQGQNERIFKAPTCQFSFIASRQVGTREFTFTLRHPALHTDGGQLAIPGALSPDTICVFHRRRQFIFAGAGKKWRCSCLTRTWTRVCDRSPGRPRVLGGSPSAVCTAASIASRIWQVCSRICSRLTENARFISRTVFGISWCRRFPGFPCACLLFRSGSQLLGELTVHCFIFVLIIEFLFYLIYF